MKEYSRGETPLGVSKFMRAAKGTEAVISRPVRQKRVPVISRILLVSCLDVPGLRGGTLAPHRRRLERAAKQLDALRQPRLHRQGAEPSRLPEWDGDLLLYNQTAPTRAGTSGVVLPGIGPAL